MICVLKIILI